MSQENRIARIAREIVNDVSPGQILDFVRDVINPSELNRLHQAVEPDYLKDQERLKALQEEIKALPDEASKKLLEEYATLWWADHCNQQTVFFNLGFAAAMRLFGMVTPPRLRAVG